MTAPPIKRRNYGSNHGYSRVDNGQKVPGVTTILSNGMPKPALINWAGNVTAEYAVDHWDELGKLPASKRLNEIKGAKNKDRDAAGKRGTEVHKLADAIMRDEEVTVPEPLRGHVESYIRFITEWQPEVVLLETICWNLKIPYAGTFDAIFDLPDGRRILFDLKTSRSGIFGETALQCMAYARAEGYIDANGEAQPMPQVDGIAAIHCRADGYDVHELDYSEDTWMRFRYVAAVARTCDDLRELVGPAATPPVLMEESA